MLDSQNVTEYHAIKEQTLPIPGVTQDEMHIYNSPTLGLPFCRAEKKIGGYFHLNLRRIKKGLLGKKEYSPCIFI